MKPINGLEKLVQAFKRNEDQKVDNRIKAGIKKGDISQCEADELRLQYVDTVISEYESGEYSIKKTMKMLDRVLKYSTKHGLDTSKIKEAGFSVAEQLIENIDQDLNSLNLRTAMSNIYSGADAVEHCIEKYDLNDTELILNYHVLRSLTEDDIRTMQAPHSAEQEEHLSIAGKTKMIFKAMDAADNYHGQEMESHFQEYKDRTGKDMPEESKKVIVIDYLNAGLNKFDRQLDIVLQRETTKKPKGRRDSAVDAYNLLQQIDQESVEYGFETGLEKRFGLLIEPLHEICNRYIIDEDFEDAIECLEAAKECIGKCKEVSGDILFYQRELEDMTDPELSTTEEKVEFARKRAGIPNPEGINKIVDMNTPSSESAISHSVKPASLINGKLFHYNFPSSN